MNDVSTSLIIALSVLGANTAVFTVIIKKLWSKSN